MPERYIVDSEEIPETLVKFVKEFKELMTKYNLRNKGYILSIEDRDDKILVHTNTCPVCWVDNLKGWIELNQIPHDFQEKEEIKH